MKYLLDTNIASYVIRKDNIARLYWRELIYQPHTISAMSAAELLLWAKIRQWGKKRQENHIHAYFQQVRILPLTEPIWQLWAELRFTSRQAGRALDVADAFIAATALHYNTPLVTHNAKDFELIPNLQLISYSADSTIEKPPLH